MARLVPADVAEYAVAVPVCVEFCLVLYCVPYVYACLCVGVHVVL